MSAPLRLPAPLRRGDLPDTLRHLSDGAVGAAQHLGHGLTHGLTVGAAEAAHAAQQLAAGAADAVSATRQTVRPRRRRLPRGPVLVVVFLVVAVVASRWWAGRDARLRPADVPTPVAAPAVDDDAVAADAGGAMA
jgi:hypothetical protein